MAWLTLRKATADDISRLEECALRFAERHNIDDEWADTWTQAVDGAVTYARDGGRLERAWLKCVRRLLGPGVDGIAHGYVGSHVE